jgi:hypothetical protein
MNKYVFYFRTGPGKGVDRKLIRWERMGSDMYDAFDLAIEAAVKDYPDASAFHIFAA